VFLSLQHTVKLIKFGLQQQANVAAAFVAKLDLQLHSTLIVFLSSNFELLLFQSCLAFRVTTFVCICAYTTSSLVVVSSYQIIVPYRHLDIFQFVQCGLSQHHLQSLVGNTLNWHRMSCTSPNMCSPASFACMRFTAWTLITLVQHPLHTFTIQIQFSQNKGECRRMATLTLLYYSFCLLYCFI
jgi:hypothetical protein